MKNKDLRPSREPDGDAGSAGDCCFMPPGAAAAPLEEISAREVEGVR